MIALAVKKINYETSVILWSRWIHKEISLLFVFRISCFARPSRRRWKLRWYTGGNRLCPSHYVKILTWWRLGGLKQKEISYSNPSIFKVIAITITACSFCSSVLVLHCIIYFNNNRLFDIASLYSCCCIFVCHCAFFNFYNSTLLVVHDLIFLHLLLGTRMTQWPFNRMTFRQV